MSFVNHFSGARVSDADMHLHKDLYMTGAASRTARLDGDDSGCDSLEPSPDGDPPVCMRGVRGGEELGRPPAGAGVPGGLANMSPST